MIARLLREPLLHFLLAGALLFAIFGRTDTDAGKDDHQIVVTAADSDRLAASFSRTWNRPPDAQELQAQIQDYIREEVLYRTALSLGLDKDDAVIRRRLRQKMEFLLEDTIPPATEAELRAYYQGHTEKFRSPALISFRQIFVSARRGGSADADAKLILAHLVADAPGAEEEGDPFTLSEGFSRTPVDQIARQFGDDFARKLTQAKPGHWTGPLRSAYGLHIAIVTEYQPTTLAPFEQVRVAVEREWFAGRRIAAQADQYRTLVGRYKIVIQQPVNAR
jgi:hypothetical protein